MPGEETTFEGWAILELMGHRRLAGYVEEVEVAGHGMLRIDIPGVEEETGEWSLEGAATQFYSPGALYCLTPTTEEMARAVATRSRPQPVHRWELPPAAPTASDPDLELREDIDAADGELDEEEEWIPV